MVFHRGSPSPPSQKQLSRPLERALSHHTHAAHYLPSTPSTGHLVYQAIYMYYPNMSGSYEVDAIVPSYK